MNTFRVWRYTWSWKVHYMENTCYIFIQGIHKRDMQYYYESTSMEVECL